MMICDVKLVNTFLGIGKLSISKYRYGEYPHLISVLHLELQIRNLLQNLFFCVCVCICIRFILSVYAIVI